MTKQTTERLANGYILSFVQPLLKTNGTIITPAEDLGWDVWNWSMRRSKLRKTVGMLDELPGNGRDAIIGLPAQSCTTIAVPVPTADQSLFSDMAFAQLEKRGLSNGSPEGTVFTHHVIERDSSGSLLSVDVLPQDFNDDLCVKDQPAGYTAGARLYPVSDNTVVLLREHGRILLLAGKKGRMTFSQILTSGTEFNEGFVQEVNLTMLTLQGSGQIDPGSAKIEIWVEMDEDTQHFLKHRFTQPVSFPKKPGPDPRLVKDAAVPMLPFQVQERIRRKIRWQKIRIGILLTLLVYVIAAMALGFIVTQRMAEAERLEKELAENRPRTEFIKQSLTRSRMLDPAIDKKFYPMRQLNQITGAMPASGIVVHRFITKGQTVRLEGLAKDSQIAYQLKDDLAKHPDFRGYTWDMATPSVNSQNNTATFRIDGKYATAKP